MILATLKNGKRDGALIVVSKDRKRYVSAERVSPTLQAALDDWKNASPKLLELSQSIALGGGLPLEVPQLLAPLPRAYEWIDGSAFLNHVELVRKARGAEMPESFKTDPLIYQGGSGVLLAPTEPISLRNEEWGCDFESEVCVILADTPQGTSAAQAPDYVRLIVLANDVSLRNLIPKELEKGFGFFQSKPATAFSPFALTPDELGNSWREGKLHLPLITTWNGKKFGDPDAGAEMHFSFFQLIEHITKTRAFTAGTILGSGTISMRDKMRGSSCIAEKRMIEKIETGAPITPFLKVGDRVRIEILDTNGLSLFGAIDQTVTGG